MTDKKDLDNVGSDSALRDAAEGQLGKFPDTSTEIKDLTPEEIIHELRVHQIELEMQNEELQRVQLQLEESRDKYQDLYDFAPVGYFTLSQKGLISEANLTGASQLGMPRPKLINLGFGHFVAPESEDQYYQHILNVRKQEGKQFCDLMLKSEDGSSFYAHLESVRMDAPVQAQKENGATHVIRMAVIDITDRKMAEDAVRFSEELFHGMFENHAAVMLLIEPATGRIIDANIAAERFYGYATSELRSMCIQEINILPPDEVAIERNLALSQRRSHFIFPHRLADGAVRTVEVHASPIEHNGKVMLFSIIHDITESKRLEAERQEMERKLLHAQKLESLGVMAGGIAHDFNNLLQVVLGNLDLALDDIPPDSEARTSILNAIKASERSAELSGQMLVYSGSAIYFPMDIYLDDLLNKTISLLQSTIPGHIAIDFDICKTLPPIKGKADQIQRLISNLVVNASEAIGETEGAVRLSAGIVDCDEAYLSHSRLEMAPEPGRFVYLEVTDTGCGMDDKTLQRLFDPFFSTKFWGRGLGMAEVMGIVKGHHGAIIVDSEIGKGTTVRVLFPLSEKLQDSSVQVKGVIETKPSVPASPTGRKSILVVEDEEMVRGLVTSRLEVLGYLTITASDGEEGVRIFRERPNEIDLVLLDFAMPRMNGVEAFAQLMRIKPDVKVILSSGYTEDVVMRSFPGKRPAGVLHKPYKMVELKGELERLLGSDG
jgi:PAS domain S-box-containing protein